ncbi:DUF1653 domain-containing protein [Oceanospirillum sp.]|uniref:DUF1653 domain-containing protein n=1 Tax=Oceanospirillum sp. TaxID=2021254 RepID=UPI003A914C95
MAIQSGIYQHYKGSKYLVVGEVRHSETEETLVLYRALYGERGLWVRPVSMFSEQVDVAGEIKPRFELIEARDNLMAGVDAP